MLKMSLLGSEEDKDSWLNRTKVDIGFRVSKQSIKWNIKIANEMKISIVPGYNNNCAHSTCVIFASKIIE